MIFILAKHMDAAKLLAASNDLLPKDWLYANRVENLAGYKNQVLWLGAGYEDHPARREVLGVAKDRCFRIFEVTEVPKYML